MKKCCVNCAFCLRTKDYGCSPLRDPSKRFVYSILNDEERKKAFSGDFNFVGSEIKARIDWEKQYNQIIDNMKKGMYNEQLGGPTVLELLTNVPNNRISQKIVDLFRLPQLPEAPDADYLSCWHNLWNFKDKEKELSTLNDKNDCLFFYPYNKKGNKSFEGCEKEREALLAKSRFMTTNCLVILGIFVTILIFAIQTWNSRQTIQTQEVVTTKENIQQTITPKTQNKNSQPSESEKK